MLQVRHAISTGQHDTYFEQIEELNLQAADRDTATLLGHSQKTQLKHYVDSDVKSAVSGYRALEILAEREASLNSEVSAAKRRVKFKGFNTTSAQLSDAEAQEDCGLLEPVSDESSDEGSGSTDSSVEYVPSKFIVESSDSITSYTRKTPRKQARLLSAASDQQAEAIPGPSNTVPMPPPQMTTPKKSQKKTASRKLFSRFFHVGLRGGNSPPCLPQTSILPGTSAEHGDPFVFPDEEMMSDDSIPLNDLKSAMENSTQKKLRSAQEDHISPQLNAAVQAELLRNGLHAEIVGEVADNLKDCGILLLDYTAYVDGGLFETAIKPFEEDLMTASNATFVNETLRYILIKVPSHHNLSVTKVYEEMKAGALTAHKAEMKKLFDERRASTPTYRSTQVQFSSYTGMVALGIGMGLGGLLVRGLESLFAGGQRDSLKSHTIRNSFCMGEARVAENSAKHASRALQLRQIFGGAHGVDEQ
ncbi:hypothetical protein COOONC_02780 [Cooperia oncophora]